MKFKAWMILDGNSAKQEFVVWKNPLQKFWYSSDLFSTKEMAITEMKMYVKGKKEKDRYSVIPVLITPINPKK